MVLSCLASVEIIDMKLKDCSMRIPAHQLATTLKGLLDKVEGIFVDDPHVKRAKRLLKNAEWRLDHFKKLNKDITP